MMRNSGSTGVSPGASDIVPGVVAAVGFLVITFVLHFPLLVGGLLSAGVYFGLRLLMPSPNNKAASDDSNLESVVARTVKESESLTPLLREKAVEVCNVASNLLHIAKTSETRATDIHFAVAEYMNVVRQGIGLYQDRSAATTSGPQSRAALEQMLDSVYQRLDSLHDSIVHEDDSKTAREMDTLNRTVKDMDDVLIRVQRNGESE